MPRTRLRLVEADLHYPPELAVHTSTSGRIDRLAARILHIETADGFSGFGEVRANIPYLTKLAEETITPAIVDLCRRLPWGEDPAAILDGLDVSAKGAPAIARAAIENTLIDGLARRAGQPVAVWLGGSFEPEVATNQCLFWGPDEQFDALAARYTGEGFRDLKVRIAIADLDRDLARLGRLRERYGDTITLAVDANGVWSKEEALAAFARLAPLRLAYVEQPTRPGDWDAFRAVLAATDIPLMLDESLIGPDDIERLAQFGPRALGHLKIVKLGGPLAVMRAARRLTQAGVGVMIGQMNEGALATALTVHCAMAAEPEYAELYGCYGLLDDVTSGLRYAGGTVRVPEAPGLGVAVDLARGRVVFDETAS